MDNSSLLLLGALRETCLNVGDFLLGWLMALHRDLALCGLVLLTSLVMIAIRRLASNRSLLRDLAADERCLRKLLRQARAAADRNTQNRLRKIRMRIASLRLRAETPPAIPSIIVLGVILTWASARFEYLPPMEGKPLSLTLEVPLSSVGRAAHVVPQPGLHASDGWIRIVKREKRNGVLYGQAVWNLQFRRRSSPYLVALRLENETFLHEVLVDGKGYQPPKQTHLGDIRTTINLQPYRPLGLIGRIPGIGVDAWILVYVGATVPIFLLVKRLAKLA